MISGGMAFSIPSNAASAWLEGARERRPRLGVGLLPVVLPAPLRRGDQSRRTGLVIAAIDRGGPVDRAGLLIGDVLLEVSGEPADDLESLLDALAHAGNTVQLRLARGGIVFDIEVDLEARGPGRAA